MDDTNPPSTNAGDLRTCAECAQPYVPFPVRESRLCAPCVYRLVTRWSDMRERRRLLELAMRAGASGAAALAQELGSALAVLPSVRHAVVLVAEDDGRLVQRYPAAPRAAVTPEPVRAAVAALPDGPVFTRDLQRDDPDAARVLHGRGWTLVTALRIGTRLLGAIAVTEQRRCPLARVGDLELFATVAAAATGGLERARLCREVERAQAAREHAERLEAIGALAGGTAHEIKNLLVTVQTLLEAMPMGPQEGDASNLRRLGFHHLRHVLDLAETLRSIAGGDGVPGAPPAIALVPPGGRHASRSGRHRHAPAPRARRAGGAAAHAHGA